MVSSPIANCHRCANCLGGADRCQVQVFVLVCYEVQIHKYQVIHAMEFVLVVNKFSDSFWDQLHL